MCVTPLPSIASIASIRCLSRLRFTVLAPPDYLTSLPSPAPSPPSAGCIALILAVTMMAEAVIYIVPSVREAYIAIPAVSFSQFLFSGLMLKPCLLPRWMAPWIPSISIIRWTLQGLCINYFQDNAALFPQLPGYDTYTTFMSLYGWGGKSKWYCLNMVLVMLVIMRIGTVIVITVRASTGKGGVSSRREIY